MAVGECPTCRQLMDAITESLRQHLDAVTALQSASIEGDLDRSREMEALVRLHRQVRQTAVDAYREHQASHDAGSAPVV